MWIRRYYRVEMNNNLLCMTCGEKTTDEKCNMNFENQIIIGTGCDIPSLLLICNDSKKLRCGEKPNISSVYEIVVHMLDGI